MRYRIQSLATSPEGRLYAVVAILSDDGVQIIATEDILADVRRGDEIVTDANGWWQRGDGSVVPPWTYGADGEWHRPAEDAANPFARQALDVGAQLLDAISRAAPRWASLRGDNVDPDLAARCSVRGDEPDLNGYEGVV